jgi:hypothetical protein
MKKAIIITILTLFLIVIVSGVYLFSQISPNTCEIPGENIGKVNNIECWKHIKQFAIEKKDASLCTQIKYNYGPGSIPDDAIAQCITDTAVTLKDPSICNTIKLAASRRSYPTENQCVDLVKQDKYSRD